MSQTIELREQGLSVVILVTDEKDVRFLHFSALPPDHIISLDEKQQQFFRLLELQVTGENQDALHGSKNTGTLLAKRLRYVGHHDYHSSPGRKLEGWKYSRKGKQQHVIETFNFVDAGTSILLDAQVQPDFHAKTASFSGHPLSATVWPSLQDDLRPRPSFCWRNHRGRFSFTVSAVPALFGDPSQCMPSPST